MHVMQTTGSAVAAASEDRTGRRQALTQLALACMLAIAMMVSYASFAAQDASAGEIGYINTDGAPLMVHPTDHSVIEWMAEGTPVDILYGPHDGMYEVRYYGVDGWVWAEYLGLDSGNGNAAANVGGGGASAPVAAPSGPERWIDGRGLRPGAVLGLDGLRHVS
jgi:hypothetical protein